MGLGKTLKNTVTANGYSGTHEGSNSKKYHGDQSNIQLLKMNKKRKEDDIRIIGGNVNTFPVTYSSANKMKKEKLKNIICNTDVDILAISEHNLNVRQIALDQRPSEVIAGWRAKSIATFGYMDNSKNTYSLGGNGIVSFDELAKKMIQTGHDNKKLGRWTWNTYKGKNDKQLTIISCYRPDVHQVTYRTQLAQLVHKDDVNTDKYDHKRAWYNDLETLIKSKLAQEHEIIVVGDFNEDLENEESDINKLMKELDMSNSIKSRYGLQKATHIRGSHCIDGIYATGGVEVLQGGYIPFEWAPGDHRWPWVDVSIKGSEDIISSTIPPLVRKATSKIPSIKKEFNDKLNDHLKSYGIEEKINELENLTKDKNVAHELFSNLYESIDERFRRGVTYADKRCKKGRRGPIPFSDDTKRVLGTYTLLKMILLRHRLKKKRGRPSMTRIRRLAKKVNSTIPLTYKDEKDILEQCKLNAKEYKVLEENADELRDTYLSRLAQEFSDEDGKDVKWHITQLRRREKIKKHWSNIKRYEYRGRSGGVDKVDVETENGMATIFDKDKIVDEIIKANGAKRLQANNTPFRTEPLRTEVGEKGNFARWEKILDNTFSIPDIDDYEEGTKHFIKYLQGMKKRDRSIEWTQQEYISSWRKMKEDKSSYPGITTAHMKCIHQDSLAARVASTLALVPFKTGYCPNNWKLGIDSMIPKKDMKEYRPKKLRLILLMDVRFNHANKLVGKMIMEQGEHYGLLSNE